MAAKAETYRTAGPGTPGFEPSNAELDGLIVGVNDLRKNQDTSSPDSLWESCLRRRCKSFRIQLAIFCRRMGFSSRYSIFFGIVNRSAGSSIICARFQCSSMPRLHFFIVQRRKQTPRYLLMLRRRPPCRRLQDLNLLRSAIQHLAIANPRWVASWDLAQDHTG